MPTTYAHWRFGDRALRELSPDLKAAALKYRELYDFGAQGPDLFFHYKCLKSNEVTRYGSWMHETPMKEHLAAFKSCYAEADHKEATLAYLLGFLAHFMLDSYCHGYIDLKAEMEGPSHDKIEAQYDRHLLIRDGRDPYKTKVTFSLKPSDFNASVVAALYGRWDKKVILRSMRDQVFYRNLQHDSSDLKRFVLSLAMKAAGASKFLDMMMGKDELPSCVSSNMRLDKYSGTAAAHTAVLAENMMRYLEGEAEPDPYFDHDFGPKASWRDIPVLPPEKEKDYQADLQD